MPELTEDFDIAIVGGGVTGLVLGCLIGACRLRAVLIDAGELPQEPDADVALRVSALSLRSRSVLESCGVWPQILAERASPYRSMCVWDGASAWDAADAVRFDAAALGVDELGHIVENELARRHLYRALRETGCTIKTGIALVRFERAGRFVELGLDSGAQLRARLVVGADGARSRVRDFAAVTVRRWHYEQLAFVTHVKSERPHALTAWQRFNADGPLALLPLADGRSSVVYSTSAENAKHLVATDAERASRALTLASGSVLGGLQIAAGRATFPLAAEHAERYAVERCVLLGDAAHRVHPLAGQGLNLGIADAAELARVLVAAGRTGNDPGDLVALKRYERRRRSENERMLRILDAMHRLFRSESGAVSRLRRGGMLAFNRTTTLKRMAARVAMGIEQHSG